MKLALGVAIVALVLAGCGGTSASSTGSQPTGSSAVSTVEQDLGACVIETAWGSNAPSAYQQSPGQCNPVALNGAQYGPASATCTYSSGNSYVCQVTASGSDSVFAAQVNGVYNVTYDGNSIAYERSS